MARNEVKERDQIAEHDVQLPSNPQTTPPMILISLIAFSLVALTAWDSADTA